MKVYIDWPNACATLVTGICIDNSRVCVCFLSFFFLFFYSTKYYVYSTDLIKLFGNTLLEGVCIRLTSNLHNHDMTYVINMKEVLGMFLTTVIKCHSLSYDIFNANIIV